MMKMLVNEDEDLENSIETVCSICDCYEEITQRNEIGWYAIFVRNIFACYACEKVPILNKTFTAKSAPSEVNL